MSSIYRGKGYSVHNYFILKKVFKFDALCYKRYATINVNRPASLGRYHWLVDH